MTYRFYAHPDPRFRFIPDAGQNFAYGIEPQIAARLNQLAELLHQNIYGISGYRTPAHSVAVGGFSNDPHTKGIAADIGVGSSMRVTAGGLSEAQLESVGLTRPFGGAQEINHVQLLDPQQAKINAIKRKLAGDNGPLGVDALGGPLASLGGPIDNAAKSAGKAIGGAAGDAASSAANATANAIVDLVSSWAGKDAARAGLYVVLVVGALAMLYTGTRRALGAGS